MTNRKKPELKSLFLERMKKIIPNADDFESYLKILNKESVKSIRCNILKISPENLIKRLEKKYSWKIIQPFAENPEIIIVVGKITDEKNLTPLLPGELGRSLEHLLGYYYIQEISSMLPIIALSPEKDEFVLDLCASPGSKTTQASAKMQNTGTIIANEISLGRLKILSSNLERCGVTNAIVTKKEGIAFCEKLKKFYPELKFDKILVDAPCSGEGTLRSSPKTSVMWNINTIKQLSGLQKKLVASAIELLKPDGELVYSTCTHAPEENEEIADFILKNFPEMKIEKISFPKELKIRKGMTQWENKKYSDEIKKTCRIYPQDNDTEGFFIAKFKKFKI